MCRYFKDSRKCYKIFFEGRYVTHFPWTPNNEHIPLLNGFTEVPLQFEGFKIARLCRFTHNAQANSAIQDENHYIFKPRRQFGRKIYVASSCDIPSTESIYCHIPKNVISGCYVRWSIDLSLPKRKVLLKKETDKLLANYYLSEPFMTHSNCGNIKFEISTENLIKCYQKSFIGPLQPIQFRCGGTLREKYKINYLIIVCLQHHNDFKLVSFPVMWSNIIKYKRNGEISRMKIPLQVMLKNCISRTCVRNLITNEVTTESFSWDTCTFLFYFPNKQHQLKCPKNMINKKIVVHKFCKYRQPDIDGTLKCPNELQVEHKHTCKQKRKRKHKCKCSNGAKTKLSKVQISSLFSPCLKKEFCVISRNKYFFDIKVDLPLEPRKPSQRSVCASRKPSSQRSVRDSRKPSSQRSVRDSRKPSSQRSVRDSRKPSSQRSVRDSRKPSSQWSLDVASSKPSSHAAATLYFKKSEQHNQNDYVDYQKLLWHILCEDKLCVFGGMLTTKRERIKQKKLQWIAN